MIVSIGRGGAGGGPRVQNSFIFNTPAPGSKGAACTPTTWPEEVQAAGVNNEPAVDPTA